MRAVLLIQNKNKSLTEFITNSFQTSRTDEIAGTKVRKKLYAKNDGVRQAVRTWLVRMIEYIDRNTGKYDQK